jgi:hypothetical protein
MRPGVVSFRDQPATTKEQANLGRMDALSALMGLYAELSRMRILSSEEVVDSADQVVKRIVDTYLEPNKTFPELRKMANSGLIDPLRNFSEACRSEFQFLRSPFDR